MTITSVFYDGPVTESQWANASHRVGSSECGVLGGNDWKVTAHPTDALKVNVNTGSGWAHGISDSSNSVVTITCDAIAAGATRYDLISCYRDWQPSSGGPTTFRKVNGSTARTIPASRANSPGTTFDQPLALVKWVGGFSTPQEIVDLRCWAGNGGMVAKDKLALDYLTRLGTRITIDKTAWLSMPASDGTQTWVPEGAAGGMSLFGIGAALNGSPPSGQVFLPEIGTVVLKTDNAGFATMNWPVAFPNGLLTVIAWNGDEFTTGRGVTVAAAGGTFWPNGYGTKTAITFSVSTASGAAYTLKDVRINWIAIGW
jgi:hypothetical protein